MTSKFVRFEIEAAVKRWKEDKNFKLLVVHLDGHPLKGIPKQVKYDKWDKEDVPGSVLNIISNLTGHNPYTSIAAPAFLSIAPLMFFDNQSKTQHEHTKNFVLYYLAHLKNLLQSIANTRFQDSITVTAAKLNGLWLMEQLPALQQGIMPSGGGQYEMIHANRMRIPPRVTFNSFTGP